MFGESKIIIYILLEVFGFEWSEVIKYPRVREIKSLLNYRPLELAMHFGLIETRRLLFLELEQEESIVSKRILGVRRMVFKKLSK